VTEPTNEELAEALRSIEGLPLGTRLIVRLAADRLCAERDGWIEWGGGDACPVPNGAPVIVRHRDGSEHADRAGGVHSNDWSHDGVDGDIIAYRIVK
jgi:hypothetical protein